MVPPGLPGSEAPRRPLGSGADNDLADIVIGRPRGQGRKAQQK